MRNAMQTITLWWRFSKPILGEYLPMYLVEVLLLLRHQLMWEHEQTDGNCQDQEAPPVGKWGKS
jgi:hypothetical protein